MSPIISEVLAEARERLLHSAFRPASREATLLLAHVLGWTESQVIARQDQDLGESPRQRFDRVLTRRLAGEPVAYILGFKEFYGRDFAVDRRVLIPRPETEHLVEAALDLPLPERPQILDLGTGSGCLACTMALELPSCRVLATDISFGALAVTRRNRRRHRLDRRLQLVACDLASGIDLQPFDLVVSNPPYIGTGEAPELSMEILDFEPERALFAGPTGVDLHRRLLTELAGLRSHTWLVLEIGARQKEWLRAECRNSPFELIEIRADYAGMPRVALLQRR